MKNVKKVSKKNKEATEMITRKVTMQKKLVNNVLAAEKKAINKKSMRDRQQIVAERAMNSALKENNNTEKDSFEEEHKEPKVTITDEERAQRFEKLNAIARDMTKKWKE